MKKDFPEYEFLRTYDWMDNNSDEVDQRMTEDYELQFYIAATTIDKCIKEDTFLIDFPEFGGLEYEYWEAFKCLKFALKHSGNEQFISAVESFQKAFELDEEELEDIGYLCGHESGCLIKPRYNQNDFLELLRKIEAQLYPAKDLDAEEDAFAVVTTEVECIICPNTIDAKEAATYQGLCEDCRTFSTELAEEAGQEVIKSEDVFLELIQLETYIADKNVELQVLRIQSQVFDEANGIDRAKEAELFDMDMLVEPYRNAYDVMCEDVFNNILEAEARIAELDSVVAMILAGDYVPELPEDPFA